ncbi:hypothetical protein [Microcoleus anatoxicus]|uniref:Uncharacterized protein n=1 Tax=Microcoleus anatoxicus PTRS2 TaxID=2705321 RepID=A0ABU8YM84_9CYAN
MTADNLLAIAKDLQRSCFAPTNIFALIEMHPVPNPDKKTFPNPLTPA